MEPTEPRGVGAAWLPRGLAAEQSRAFVLAPPRVVERYAARACTRRKGKTRETELSIWASRSRRKCQWSS